MMMRYLDSTAEGFCTELEQMLSHDIECPEEVESVVKTIISDVRHRGDVALLEYTRRFDNPDMTLEQIEIPDFIWQRSVDGLSHELRGSLEDAIKRITDYHQHEHAKSWQYRDQDGNLLGQRLTALDSVGVYIPGGKAAYPSSVLMNVIPAKIAGVENILMVSPAPEKIFNPLVLAAAKLTGIDRVFSVGGAQAIAALAYGTETIPKVDKITGPGNSYVAAAKRMVFGRVGIDMIAGPSEVLIVCDKSANADWVAMDLFAQAEHDEMARAILLSTDDQILSDVSDSILRLLPQMSRADTIETALRNRGVIIKLCDDAEIVSVINQIAPEHLQLTVCEPNIYLDGIRHAGAIFLGHYAAEALGDYCAGPNHVLPTAGTAKFSSPLGVYDFQKRSSFISCDRDSVQQIAKTANTLAKEEHLTAHAQSAAYRIK